MIFLFLLADILGCEQIDLSCLKKQAQLIQSQIPLIARTLNTLESLR